MNSASELLNAIVVGIILGWWMRDIGRAVRALLERPAPRPDCADGGTSETLAGGAPAREPGAEHSPRPAGGHDYRDRGGESAKDINEVHADILPQTQEVE